MDDAITGDEEIIEKKNYMYIRKINNIISIFVFRLSEKFSFKPSTFLKLRKEDVFRSDQGLLSRKVKT